MSFLPVNHSPVYKLSRSFFYQLKYRPSFSCVLFLNFDLKFLVFICQCHVSIPNLHAHFVLGIPFGKK
jgi:hypothetical protein